MKRFSLSVALLCLLTFLSCSFPVSSQSRKSVAILGDSYSTFEGYIDPESNAIWYFSHPDPQLTDVSDVKETWWHQVITDNNLRLETNNSYSGSTICNTGYDARDYSDRSFITRMKNLGSPDMIFIFGGTNDSWANSPIGEFVWSDWTPEQLKSFRPALAYMLHYMTRRYPNTEMLYLINDGLKPEITSSIIEACKHYDVPYLLLKDIQKTAGHPNKEGMKQIAKQVSLKIPYQTKN